MREKSPRHKERLGQVSSRALTCREQVFALVEKYFDAHGVPKRSARILAAVSGGPDSVAMFEVLRNLANQHNWSIAIAHVNHGLRGAESDCDESFVRTLAGTSGVRFHSRNLIVSRKPKGESVQQWARHERYRYFEWVADRHDYSHIAVAHQLNDRAETVAAAILDAGGTFALSGIPPVRGRVIRPLFEVPKQLILEFLRVEGIGFREDPSNDSTKYQRNRVRHVLMPELLRENPSAVEGLARMGDQLWQQRAYLESLAESLLSRAVVMQDRAVMILDAHRLSKYNPALDPFVLRGIINRLGLNIVPRPALVSRFAVLRCARRLDGEKSVEQGDWRLEFSHGLLTVSRKRGSSRQLNDNVLPRLDARVVARPRGRKSDDRRVARFDLDSISGALSVRWPMTGDRYQPIGLAGTKKLFDLLADRKVPSFERERVPVVVDDKGILWPVGHPIAHRARLTDQTKWVLEARLQEGSWKNRS